MILDKNLNFKEHIAYISKKCSKSIGILFRLNSFLPVPILKTLYSSMILPYLNYGIEAWFGANMNERNKIFILQKKSIRAIHRLPFNSHTNDYFKSNKLLKVPDLYKFNICSLVYRYTEPSSDLPFAVRFQTMSDIHTHNTRNSHNLVAPRYNLTKSQSSFLFNSVNEWNSIPVSIQNCSTLRTFKGHLREHYSGSY